MNPTSALDRPPVSAKSNSESDRHDDLSSILRHKRRITKSPQGRDKKRHSISTEHTRGLAERVKQVVHGSSSPPRSPIEPVPSESQTSFNSLFDSTQRESPEAFFTSGLHVSDTTQASEKSPMKEGLVLSNTANTEPTSASNVTVISPRGKAGKNPGLGFTMKDVADPPMLRKAAASNPPSPLKKKNAHQPAPVLNAAPLIGPSTATARLGKNVSMNQALSQARQRANATKSSSNISGSSTDASIISRAKKPPPGPARVIGPNLFASWDQNKKRDVRKHTSTAATKTFKSLAIQNSVRRWANGERIPDPSALRMINPKTGEVEHGKGQNDGFDPQCPPSKPDLRIDTILASRTDGTTEGHGSAPGLESRSADPQDALSGMQTYSNSTAPYQSPNIAREPGLSSARPPSGFPVSKKSTTCSHWKKGHCKYRDQECSFAHFDTGRSAAKRPIVCEHWRSGHCKHSEDVCLYMHHLPDKSNKPESSYFERQYGRRDTSTDTLGRRQGRWFSSASPSAAGC